MNEDQQYRLRIAALIKAIGDAEDDFNADYAEEIAELLRGMPVTRYMIGMEYKSAGPSQEGNAAGVGNVSMEEDEKTRSWSAGDREMRCGPYVITKMGQTSFIIRHVAEVHAAIHDGEELLLTRERGQWVAKLNYPKPLKLWFIHIYIGKNFVFWKRGI